MDAIMGEQLVYSGLVGLASSSYAMNANLALLRNWHLGLCNSAL